MRKRVSVSPGTVVVVIGCALVCAAPAAASTVSLAPNPFSGGNVVLYEAAAGEVNQLSPFIGADFVQLQDGGGASGVVINPQAPCVSGQPGVPPPAQPNNFASCPKTDVKRIVADLGDRDDTFSGMIYTLPVSVAGGGGGDNLFGGSLDDVLLGEDGQDILTGGPGNDVLDGGLGPDTLSGGDSPAFPATHGFDLVDYSERLAAVTVTLDGRTNDGEVGEGDNVATNIDDVAGGAGPDVIIGSDLANELYGEDGNDTITGGAGADLLAGDGGDDVIQARDGAVDDVRCGAGNDTAVVDTADAAAADCEIVERPTVAPPPPPVLATPAPIDRTPPNVSMTLPKRPLLLSIIARGLRVRVVCSEACTIKADLQITRAIARSLGLPTRDSSRMVVIGRATGTLRAAGPQWITVKLTMKARRALRRLRQGRITVRITATDPAGNTKSVMASIKPKRQ